MGAALGFLQWPSSDRCALECRCAFKPMQTAFQETCVSVEHCESSFDDQEAASFVQW